MNSKCETVILCVRQLVGLRESSPVIMDLVSQTSYPYEYIDKLFKDWLMDRKIINERREILTIFLHKALDLVAQTNYGQTFEQLCGPDYLQQIKLLSGEL